MDTQKPNYYAIIPAHIRYDSKLCPNEKLFYGFARLYDVEKRTIRRWLDKLKKLKYITIEMEYISNSKQINKRKIWINDKGISLPTPGQKYPPP